MKDKYIIASGIIFALIFAVQTSASAVVQNNIAKNAADKTGTTSTTTIPTAESQVFGRGIDTIKNIVPESVSSTTGSVFTKLNDFRLEEYYLVEVARIDNIEQIDIINQKEIDALAWQKSGKSGAQQNIATGTPKFEWSNHTERLLRYTYWMFLVLAGVILNYAWIFYAILFLVIIMILRAIWGRIRVAGI